MNTLKYLIAYRRDGAVFSKFSTGSVDLSGDGEDISTRIRKR
jgi:hypothetical protein